MTRRRRKILLAGGGFLLLIALGAAFGWWYFLSPARLRARVEREMTRAVNANVSVGRAQWGWLTNVTLSDVVVRGETDEAPPVMKLPTLLATISPKDLLRGRVTLITVIAENLELNIALTPELRWPFYDKLPRQEAAGRIPAVIIDNGTVRISMPDAPERFPTQEFSVIRGVADSGGGNHLNITFVCGTSRLGQLDGQVHIDRETSAFTAGFALDGLALAPALRERLPAVAIQYWDALLPEAGTVGLAGQLSRDMTRKEPYHYFATLSLRDGEFRPTAVPVAFQEMNVDARVSDGKLEQLAVTGRAGGSELTGGGQGEFRPGGVFVGAMNADARGIAFNSDLYAALPDAAKALWDAVKPQGMADVAVAVAFPEKGGPEPSARVTLHDVRAAPRWFPMELSGLNGALDWDLEKLSTEGIEGRIGGAPFKIEPGYTVLTDDGPVSIAARVDNLLLDYPFRQLAPWLGKDGSEEARALLDPLHVNGAFDLVCSALREKAGGPLRLEAALKVRDLALTHPQHGTAQNISGDLAYEGQLNSVSGRLAPGEWVLRIGKSDALWRGAHLSLEPLQLTGPADAGWKVAAAATELTVDERLGLLLPKTALPAWNRFKPTGTADVIVTVAKEAGKKRVRTDMQATVRGCAVRYAGFPYPLQDTSGTFTVVDDQLGEAHCSGKNGVASFVVDVVRSVDKDNVEAYAVHVVGSGMPLDQDLYDALPRPYQAFWESFKISGGAFERLDLRLNVFTNKSGPDPFNFTVAATVSKVKMEKAVPISVDYGNVIIEKADSDKSGAVLAEGTFYLERAQVERSVLEDVSGFFRWKENGLAIESLIGRAYDGIISGTMRVAGDRDADKSFRGDLTLYNADVAQVLQAQTGAPGGELAGRLDASMKFSTPLNAGGQFEAVGGMTIRQGTIGQLPGFLEFLNLMVLSKLTAPVFTGLEMAYEMQGALVVVDKLNLTGDFVSLDGTGHIQPDGNLELTFVPRFGPDWPKIPLISDLMREVLTAIKTHTIPINVTGNYNDPVWQINPLMPVTRLMQGIAGGVVPVEKKTGPNGP